MKRVENAAFFGTMDQGALFFCHAPKEKRPFMEEMLFQNDPNIAGHVFCSFLALVLRKELEQRLTRDGYRFEWSDIKQDLRALKQIEIEVK